MSRLDGYANLRVRFPAGDGSYRVTNDLRRSVGYPIIANRIEHFGTGTGDASDVTLDGLAVMLTDTLQGELPSISMNATYPGEPQVRLRIDMDIDVWDDVSFDGAGVGHTLVSGLVSEARDGRKVTITGSPWVILADGGSLNVTTLSVESGSTLEVRGGANGQDRIADTTEVRVATGGTDPALVLDFTGVEVVRALTIDGVPQAPGVCNCDTHPGLIGSTGSLEVREGVPCNAADIGSPHGVLDQSDIGAFIAAFVAGDTVADLNSDGLLDLLDVSVFAAAFLAGCP